MVVFLSYASEHSRLAERISIAVQQSGHEVFFDKTSLPAGGDYRTRIRRAIDGSERLVFLISPESLVPNCFALTELEIAQRKWPNPEGHVLPVMISPTDPELVPEYLKAATFLEPQGDVAEAVRRAIDEWSPLEEVDPVAETRKLLEQQGAHPAVAALVSLGVLLGRFSEEVLYKGEPGKQYRRTLRGIIKGEGARARLVPEPTEYMATAGREYDDGSGRTCRDITMTHRRDGQWVSQTTTFQLHHGKWMLQQPAAG